MTLEQIVAAVQAAHASQTALRLRGAGSKDFYGGLLAGEVLDLSGYRGIVAYEPTELYLTARCGTPLAEIEAVLAEKGQMLAFEPPHFGKATVGGCIAAGLSGPRRIQAGAVRDFVLGAKIVDGSGQLLTFGGQVMKNVAGYDVSRLLVGSMGVLGPILEVSLKVLPVPPARATLRFEWPQAQALEQLQRWAGQPLPLRASAVVRRLKRSSSRSMPRKRGLNRLVRCANTVSRLQPLHSSRPCSAWTEKDMSDGAVSTRSSAKSFSSSG